MATQPTNNKLYYQKWLMIFGIAIAYLTIVFFFVIYNELYCQAYRIIDTSIMDDGALCVLVRYSTMIYFVIVLITLVLTLRAAYVIKNTKINNPYYHTYPRPPRSNVMVFIPCYSESKESLDNTIESVILNDYPAESKSMFIVVDGHIKGTSNNDITSNYAKELLGVARNLSSCSEYELYIGEHKHVKYILLIKATNKGKKDSFLQVMKSLLSATQIRNPQTAVDVGLHNQEECGEVPWSVATEVYAHAYDNGLDLGNVDYVLMLDTDTKVDASGMRVLVDYLDSYPFTAAVCGKTNVSNKMHNFISMSQAYEYYITHYTLKAIESVFGEVLVLSGCFTLYRRSVLCNQELITKYSEEDTSNIYKANLTKLGEDRLLTNLILTLYPAFGTKYTEKANCFTEAPTNLKTLLCQRRRWTNSMIFCHLMLLRNVPKYDIVKRIRFVCILVFELWLTIFMPLLLLLGYYYALKYLVMSIITGSQHTFTTVQTIVFILIPLVMCLVLMNFKMIKYSLMFVVFLPIFSIISPIYSIFKVDDVEWGKTRATTAQPQPEQGPEQEQEHEPTIVIETISRPEEAHIR
jgi:cellulose synthase/poly-beta-1,6-N-acetylglucosamine synthase-like glycosyltransferase